MNDRQKLMSSKDIPLIEKVITWQGEGCNTGKRMMLVRFKYCSCHCPFCDTWTKMDDLHEEIFSINDVAKDMIDHSVENLMITGGEPTLCNNKRTDGLKSNFDATVDMLTYIPYEYADIETNGYNIEDLLHKVIKIQQFQETKKINISYSPKFFKDEDVNIALNKCRYLSLYEKHFPVVKVVVADERSINFARTLIKENIYNPNYLYLMPLGCTREEIQKSFPDVVKLATELKCNVSGRMHLSYDFV